MPCPPAPQFYDIENLGIVFPKYLAKLVQSTREKNTHTHAFFQIFPFCFCGNKQTDKKIVGKKKGKKIHWVTTVGDI